MPCGDAYAAWSNDVHWRERTPSGSSLNVCAAPQGEARSLRLRWDRIDICAELGSAPPQPRHMFALVAYYSRVVHFRLSTSFLLSRVGMHTGSKDSTEGDASTPPKPAKIDKASGESEEKEKEVFLEDLVDKPSKGKSKTGGAQTGNHEETPNKTPGKRQLSLMEMMGSKGGASGTATKRPRVDPVFAVPEFQATLSQKEKELLELECETMGPSWFVDLRYLFRIKAKDSPRQGSTF